MRKWKAIMSCFICCGDTPCTDLARLLCINWNNSVVRWYFVASPLAGWPDSLKYIMLGNRRLQVFAWSHWIAPIAIAVVGDVIKSYQHTWHKYCWWYLIFGYHCWPNDIHVSCSTLTPGFSEQGDQQSLKVIGSARIYISLSILMTTKVLLYLIMFMIMMHSRGFNAGLICHYLIR